MDVLEQLTTQGKELGYSGKELQDFVREQQAIQREDRRIQYDKERERMEMERERERERMALEKALKEMEVRDVMSEHRKRTDYVKAPKLLSFDETRDQMDSMDSWRNRFERYASSHKWDKSTWALNLSALLKGKALDVYARLPCDHSLDYDVLKTALLKRFDLTEDGFRHKFRSSLPEYGETFLQFSNRLSGYADRWIELSKTERTFETVRDLLLREQILNICTKDLALFLREHVPKDVATMVTLADQFREARAVSTKSLCSSFNRSRNPEHNAPGNKGHIHGGSQSGKSDNRPADTKGKGDGAGRPQGGNLRRCYRCGRQGHISTDNRNKKSAETASVQKDGTEKVCAAFLPVTNTSIYSNADFGKALCTSSDNVMPTAEGLLGNRHVKVLRDTGCSGVIVKKALVSIDDITDRTQTCLMADGSKVTASIARVSLDTPYFSGDIDAWCMENPLYDVIIGNIPDAKALVLQATGGSEARVTAVQTRLMKKDENERQKFKRMKAPKLIDSVATPDDIMKAQQSDATLERVREYVTKPGTDKAKFVIIKGIICREFVSPTVDHGKRYLQMVVPKNYREKVMSLAHDSIMSGHLAVKRTVAKVLSEFYWPGVQADVKRYCQSCDACQRTITKGKVTKAPSGKMPLIETPFQRVAVDIVGPIEPRSAKGNRYILTLMDYATRYPDAVALTSIEAERVAEALVEMFCRQGVPGELLTDMGTQFTSDVMKEPKDWDRNLGPVLFAYRDGPQESLGFTPFELIYGRSLYVERDAIVHGVASVAVVDDYSEESLNDDEQCIVEPSTLSTGKGKDYHISEQLSPNEVERLNDLLEEFSDVLSTSPGRTSLGEHDIKLNIDTPIRSK
ncbi:uncharacterized protein LOC128238066 [Mya arenaria]|uniref:uncharacterized protein LOC128238066 n=1 Tax=Mya arenaria TaxID=6604 RepID=UPI0022E82EFB|nr:uncharacterized protein LOC128238066 [Mya arenaria]